MKSEIEFYNGKTLYTQVYDILLDDIRQETYTDRLPPERELAVKFDVSVMTVKQAINRLVFDKVIYRRPRKGTFINRQAKLPGRTRQAEVCFAINSDIKAGLYDPYYYKILETIEKKLNEYSCHIVFSILENGTMKDPAMLERIRQGGFGAFLIAGNARREFADLLLANGIEPILIESNLRDEDLITVTADNETAAYEMTSFLIRQGHRRIAFVGGHKDETCSIERLAGLRRALSDNRIPYDEELVVHGGLHIADGLEAMNRLLDRGTDYTAVFCVTDNAALGAMNAMKARGLRIPEDKSVVGFDDIDMSAHIIPRLTTMRVDRARLGLMAFRKLLEVIGESKREMPKRVLVRPELVIRDSCRPIKTE